MKKLIAKFVGTAGELHRNCEEVLGLRKTLAVTHLTMSPYEKCAACEGKGYLEVPNGEDDVDLEECTACDASGYVEKMPF